MDFFCQAAIRLRPLNSNSFMTKHFSQSSTRAIRDNSRRPQHPAMPTQKVYFRPDENPMNKEEEENEGTDADYELLRPDGKPRMNIFDRRRKYARQQEPRTPILVTWAAREQIKYLHKLDPAKWPPERLAQVFPIPELEARRLVHGTTRFQPHQDHIERHDGFVRQRWKALKTGKGGNIVTPEQRKLYAEGQLNEVQAGLNVTFPVPPPPTPFKLPPPPPGPFTNLIRPYIEAQQKKEAEIASKTKPTKATSSTDLDRLPPVFIPVSAHSPPEYHTESLPPAEELHNVAGFDVVVVNDLTADDLVPEMRVRLAPRWQNPADRRPVMHETVRERIQERAAAVSPAVGDAYSRWFAQFDTNRRSEEERSVERTRQKENLAVSEELSMNNPETVPKFIKKPWETRRNTTATEESEEREVPNKIVIPEEVKRHSAIYQKGDTFYDGNGEFLYRVPGLGGFRTPKTA